MPDPHFRHAAIAMCVHDSGGAMGIDIGAAIEGLTLRELVASFDIDSANVPELPVLKGGPVEPRRGFVLHSLDWQSEHVLAVGTKWGLSGSLDVLKAIAEGNGPSRYIAALGYAGWAPGQLEGEMSRPGWYVGALAEEVLFATPAEKRWAKAFALNGIDTGHLTPSSGRA